MRTAAERREALETPAREVDGVGPSTALFAGARSRRRLARARRWNTLQNAERHTDAQTAVIIAHSTAVSMSRWVERAGWEEMIGDQFYYCNIEWSCIRISAGNCFGILTYGRDLKIDFRRGAICTLYLPSHRLDDVPQIYLKTC